MANTYRYLPDTEQDKKEMLDFLGMSSIEELFEDIPSELRLKGELTIPEADPESVLMKKMNNNFMKNLVQIVSKKKILRKNFKIYF